MMPGKTTYRNPRSRQPHAPTASRASALRPLTLGLMALGLLHCRKPQGSAEQRRDASAPSVTLAATPVEELDETPAGTGTSPLTGVLQIEAAASGTCALLVGGRVVCWGAKAKFALLEHEGDMLTPTDVPEFNQGIRSIALSRGFSCGLTHDGNVRCWQDDDDTWGNTKALAISGNAVSIVAGDYTLCVLFRGGQGACYGTRTGIELSEPKLAPAETKIRSIAIGKTICSVSRTNDVECMNEDNFPALAATEMPQIERLALGSEHACILTKDKSVLCWGKNKFGQVGDGTTTDRTELTPIKGLRDVEQLVASSDTTCALTSRGAVLCWGKPIADGLFGNETNMVTPQEVPGLSAGAAAISLGSSHACARMADKTAKCWGMGTHGELGNRKRRSSTKTALTVLK
jgi:alpha-tubulin suppressor-like RCC1 family protein